MPPSNLSSGLGRYARRKFPAESVQSYSNDQRLNMLRPNKLYWPVNLAKLWCCGVPSTRTTLNAGLRNGKIERTGWGVYRKSRRKQK